jgi:hypothetical protein
MRLLMLVVAMTTFVAGVMLGVLLERDLPSYPMRSR